MSSKYLLPLTITLFIFSCSEPDAPKSKINPAARALNDTACMLSRSGKVEDVLRAIELLDSATNMDHDYFTAYWNKLAFLNQLKQYSRSLAAAKELSRLKPNDPVFYVTIGTLCEKIGDSISADNYFERGLTLFNTELDTMDSKTKKYDFLMMNKGIDLIMLDREKEGNAILAQLYNENTDSTHRKTIAFYMNKNKKVLLDSLENFNRH